jgi:hypothetical protein
MENNRAIDYSQKLMPRIISNVPNILKADVIGWYCERGKDVRLTDIGNL